MEFVGVARYLVYDAADGTWFAGDVPAWGTWSDDIDRATRLTWIQAENGRVIAMEARIILAPECTPIRSRYAYDGDRRQMVMRTDWEPTLAPKTDPELPEKNDEKVRTANV